MQAMRPRGPSPLFAHLFLKPPSAPRCCLQPHRRLHPHYAHHMGCPPVAFIASASSAAQVEAARVRDGHAGACWCGMGVHRCRGARLWRVGVALSGLGAVEWSWGAIWL